MSLSILSLNKHRKCFKKLEKAYFHRNELKEKEKAWSKLWNNQYSLKGYTLKMGSL